MAADRRRRFLLALLLAGAVSVRGEVVPLGKGTPLTAVAPQAVKYDGAYAASLNPIPLVNHSRTSRRFNRQDLAIDIFMFADAEHAFSAFTTIRRPGAKPYSGRPDCYLQDLDMIFCAGKYVVRTRFPGFPLLHLSAYLEWLQTQFPEQVAVPSNYLRLPDSGLLSYSRRHLVGDFQVEQLWPGTPAGLFGLDRGNRLTVALYRRGGQECWAGWLRTRSGGEAAPVLEPEAVPWPEWRVETRAVEGRYAVTVFPEGSGDWAHTVMDALERSGRSANGQTVDRSGYFRRDQFTYSSIVFRGLQLVLIFLAIACVAAVAVFLLRRLSQKLRGTGSGLDRDTVCHLQLDGMPGRDEKKGNFSGDDR
jgi:hypothetical protein